jgi:hypothetical protein
MSVSRVQIEVELHAAERALEAAAERRREAEQALWTIVRESGKNGIARDEAERRDAELAEAKHAQEEAQAFVVELRQKLRHAEDRENRLLAITDMLIAREEARRTVMLHASPAVAKPRGRSLFHRLWRH